MPLAELASRLKKSADVAIQAEESIRYLRDELKETVAVCRRRLIYLDHQLDQVEGENNELELGTQQARNEALCAKEALAKREEELQVLRSKLDAEVLEKEKAQQERAIAQSEVDAAVHAKDTTEQAKAMALSELEVERNSRAALAREGYTHGYNAAAAEVGGAVVAQFKASEEFEQEVQRRITSFKKSAEMGAFIREAMAEVRRMGVTEAAMGLGLSKEELPDDLQAFWDTTSRAQAFDLIEHFGADLYAGLDEGSAGDEPTAEAAGSGEPDLVVIEDNEETSHVATPGVGEGEEGSGDQGSA